MTSPPFPAPGSTDIALSVRSHERVGERRVDEEWLAQAWVDPATRIVPLAVTRVPVSEQGDAVRWQTADRLPEEGLRLFLGMHEDAAHFALVLGEPTDEARWASRSRTPASWCTRWRSPSGTPPTTSARAAAGGCGPPARGTCWSVNSAAASSSRAATRR